MGPLKFIIMLSVILWPFQLYAVKHALLIDRSGSMKPHFASGLVPELCQTISGLLERGGNVDIIAFGTSQQKIYDCSKLTVSKEHTLLDRALDFARANRPDILWMVTDNIQDEPGSTQARNTEAFYEKLKRDDVTKVVIFPLAQLPGTQGIVVYAILFTKGEGPFDKEVQSFLEQAKKKYKTEALLMRPLDRNTIEVSEPQIVNEGSQVKRKVYNQGDPINENVEIRFRSRFEHLVLKGALINPPESEWQSSLDSPLLLTNMRSTITPEKISNLTSLGETEGYRISVQTAPIKLKKDLSSLWTMAFAGSEETVVLDIKFVIQVPQGNFSFKQSFLQSFHATTEAEAKSTGKIYGIGSLPTLLGTVKTDISVHIPLKITVTYPWWPAFLLVAILLMALAGIGGVTWAAVTYGPSLLPGRAAWTLRAESGSGRPLPCDLASDGAVIVQDDPVGTVRASTFIVSEGIEGEGKQHQFSLKGETRVAIRKERTSIVLTFIPQKVWGTERGEEEERSVGRRR